MIKSNQYFRNQQRWIKRTFILETKYYLIQLTETNDKNKWRNFMNCRNNENECLFFQTSKKYKSICSDLCLWPFITSSKSSSGTCFVGQAYQNKQQTDKIWTPTHISVEKSKSLKYQTISAFSYVFINSPYETAQRVTSCDGTYTEYNILECLTFIC